MYDTNNEQNQMITLNSIVDVSESSRKHSSAAKRRAVRERLDEINEQRALRRLIEEEWNY